MWSVYSLPSLGRFDGKSPMYFNIALKAKHASSEKNLNNISYDNQMMVLEKNSETNYFNYLRNKVFNLPTLLSSIISSVTVAWLDLWNVSKARQYHYVFPRLK